MEEVLLDEVFRQWLREMGVTTDPSPGPYLQFYSGKNPIGYVADAGRAYFLTDFLKRTHCPWRRKADGQDEAGKTSKEKC